MSSFLNLVDLDLQSVLDPSPSSKQLFPNSTETADAPSLLTDNLLGTQETEPDAPQSSRLSLIAASANEMVPQEGLALESNVPLMLYKDPLGGMYYQAPDGADAVLEPSTEQQQTQDSDFDTATQRAAMYPRPIAMQPNSPSPAVQGGSGETLQSGKNKSRSQFSEARRKEVQIVRQKGACLRCRMLKKTVGISRLLVNFCSYPSVRPVIHVINVKVYRIHGYGWNAVFERD